jgi:hypothetical protein
MQLGVCHRIDVQVIGLFEDRSGPLPVLRTADRHVHLAAALGEGDLLMLCRSWAQR